jgi:hypothetical protein
MKMICSVCQRPLKYKTENDDPEDLTYEVEPCGNCIDECYNDGFTQGYDEGVESVETEDEPESD